MLGRFRLTWRRKGLPPNTRHTPEHGETSKTTGGNPTVTLDQGRAPEEKDRDRDERGFFRWRIPLLAKCKGGTRGCSAEEVQKKSSQGEYKHAMINGRSPGLLCNLGKWRPGERDAKGNYKSQPRELVSEKRRWIKKGGGKKTSHCSINEFNAGKSYEGATV